MNGYPHLRAVGGADLRDESPGFLAALDRVGADLGQTIDVFSGYRRPGSTITDEYGRTFQVPASDPHAQRLAADANIAGRPIGVFPGAMQAIAREGLRSGNVAGFYNGRPDPAHVDAMNPQGTAPSTDWQHSWNQNPLTRPQGSSTANPEGGWPSSPAAQEIIRRATEDNLDPGAVLAVAAVEGGFTQAPGHYDPDTQGNPGWSYGPFQLRSPGRLPVSSAGPHGPGERYAWSKPGIDYAVDSIAKVAQGRQGYDAIDLIVRKFEQPANPSGEVARARRVYDAYSKGGDPNALTRSGQLQPSGPGSTNPGGLIGGAASTLDFLSNAWNFVFSARGLEVFAGFLLVVLGVLWLARGAIPPAVRPGGAGVGS